MTASLANLYLGSSLKTVGGTSVIGSGDISSPNFSGNLGFTGTGNRITGDFSNATVANQVAIQSSTTNGSTNLNLAPNGTSLISAFTANNNANILNSHPAQLIALSTEMRLAAAAINNGGGTYLPMTFWAGGLERMRIDTSGRVGIGVTPSAWSGTSSLDVGTTGAYSAGGGVSYLSLNSYFDGTNYRAKVAAAGNMMYQAAGGVTWYQFASVAAGAVQTAVQTLALDASGNLTAAGTITASSDERLKTDWADLPSNFVDQLSEVKHGTYTRTDQDIRQVGVSAQSLQTLLPEAVLKADGEDGMLSVAYGNAALAACVELAKKVVSLEARLAALESKA